MESTQTHFSEVWKSQVGNEALSKWQKAEESLSQHELIINGREVMQDWEAPLMEELARLVGTKGGRVLEVGFGMGISASYIQQYPQVTEHVVIEANESVFKRLQEFAKTAPQKVTPLFGFWQDVVDKLEDNSFDGILFDPYPISQSEELDYNYYFIKVAYRLLKKGGILTYYSDEVDYFRDIHLQKIREAGFIEIEYKLIPVSPPETCEYWKATTMLSPKLTKL